MVGNNKHMLRVYGKKKWWKLIFPFFCFGIALAIFFNGVERMFTEEEPHYLSISFGWTFAAGLFIILGCVFGMVKDYYFDFQRKRYKVVKRVGSIGFGTWHAFKSLEYVSVFQNSGLEYDVNLWYNANKYLNVYTFTDRVEAIQAGSLLAKNLKIDFHNAMDNQIIYENEEAVIIPEEERKIDAHLSQGNRPLWQTIIAALLYTAALGLTYFFLSASSIDFEHKQINLPFVAFEIPLILLGVAISLSVVNDYLFDFENKQFKIVHNIGPIRWGKWRPIKSLDYISIFQKVEGRFQVNLWYNKNKHIKLSVFLDYHDAVKAGKQLAKKLRTDLYDASDPHNTKWLSLD